MGGAGPFKRKLTRHGAAIENKLTIENKLNFAYGTLSERYTCSRAAGARPAAAHDPRGALRRESYC